MKKGRYGKREKRVFFCSFSMTLAVLIFTLGIGAVDVRGRAMSFGDHEPAVSVNKNEDGTSDLNIKLLGQERTVDFTDFDKIIKYICEFGCIPYK